MFYSSLKFGRREFDSPCDAIAHEFTARRPTDLLLLGLRLAKRSPLLMQSVSAGRRRGLRGGRRERGADDNHSGHDAGT
jgi:hypothetical protein